MKLGPHTTTNPSNDRTCDWDTRTDETQGHCRKCGYDWFRSKARPPCPRPKHDTNDSAVGEFIVHKAEIDKLLHRLVEHSEDLFDVGPDEVNWATVGTLGEIENRLRQLSNFVFDENK